MNAARASVVSIVTLDRHGQPLRHGSGFFISEDGDVVTNIHVLEGAKKALIRSADGREGEVVEVMRHLSMVDLAVVSTTIRKSSPIVINYSDRMGVGDGISALAAATDGSVTVSGGSIKGTKLSKLTKIFEITPAVSPGASGGPVVDEEGRAVGVAASYHHLGPDYAFAIPIRFLQKMTKELMPVEALKKPRINIGVKWGSSSVVDIANVHYKTVKYRDDADLTLEGIEFAVRNNSNHALSDMKLVVVYNDFLGKPLSFYPLEVKGPIPAKLGLQGAAKHRVDHWGSKALKPVHGRVELRILDYKVD